jgi:hypothetical protein
MKKPIVMIWLIMIMFAGCSKSSQPTETQLKTTTDVYLRGQTFSTELTAAHADGGWYWFCDIGDTNVVRLDSMRYLSLGSPGVLGAPELQTFYFRTIEIGLTTVNLNECRFRKDNPPTDSVRLVVRVIQ